MTTVSTQTILILDDLRLVRMQFRMLLASTGYRVVDFETPAAATHYLSTHSVDLVILDLNIPGVEGLSLLRQLRANYPHIPVIMATVSTDPHDVRNSLKTGAFDYVFKDELMRRPELLQISVRAALASHASVGSIGLDSGDPSADFFVPDHPDYRKPYHLAVQAVQAGMSTLILGETGVGKGMLVRHIHRQIMPDGPLVTVNCGAIMASLAEAELFGTEQGAYTDSKSSLKGKLEQADGGLLFLDEIGNLSMSIQEKLLCAIESQRIVRLGSSQERQLQFRVIAATNADLIAAIGAQAFRSDLYYRIKQFSVTLPALRENPDCILAFSRRYVSEFNTLFGCQFELGPTHESFLTTHPWPGNLRELKNEIRMMVWLHSQGEVYAPSSQVAKGDAHPPSGLYNQLEHTEATHLRDLLAEHHYNLSAIARVLGIPRSTLQGRLKKYNLYPRSTWT